ncbi:MAG: DAK2 domain-containing protein [Chloroflexi bacterium]|nr:DAK2 domain-containing protein [Chloroflexota bacterium]
MQDMVHDAELDRPTAAESLPDSVLDGNRLHDALAAGSAWLEQHIDLINSLNVFPVPDGDTGTNMFLTMQAALKETSGLACLTVPTVIQGIAHGALMGARGNSGVILSQILRGMAKVLAHTETVGGSDLARALTEGANTAYKGVIKPVEGTILTVVREAADVATKAAAGQDDIRHVLEVAVQEARASVARTPSLLPTLREAGVVDSGGQGLLTFLEGMLKFLRGEEMSLARIDLALAAPEVSAEGAYGYEALFMLKGTDLPVEQIRATLSMMGDSVLAVGDEIAVKVHIHTGRPGAVIDYAISLGSISDVVIENLQAQTEVFRREAPTAPAEVLTDTAIVTVASGAGLQEVFRTLGASAIVSGGQTSNPSTEELLKALEGLSASKVILLPNNSNIILAAQQAKQMSKKNVQVVPTKTIPQGISALLAFNYQADLDTNVAIMTEAIKLIQTAEITTAVRSAQVNGLRVNAGETIGLLNDQLTASGPDALHVIDKLLQQMQAGQYDIVTVYYGDSVSAEEAQAVAEHIQQAFPGPEVEVVHGQQPHYQYIISAE